MRFFYMDRSGTGSLFEQTINEVEKEFDRRRKTNPIGALEEKTTLARRLGELLGLGEMTAGEPSADRKSTSRKSRPNSASRTS